MPGCATSCAPCSTSPFFDPMKFLTDEKGNLSPDQQRDIEAAFYRSIQQPIAQVLQDGVQRGDCARILLCLARWSFSI